MQVHTPRCAGPHALTLQASRPWSSAGTPSRPPLVWQPRISSCPTALISFESLPIRLFTYHKVQKVISFPNPPGSPLEAANPGLFRGAKGATRLHRARRSRHDPSASGIGILGITFEHSWANWQLGSHHSLGLVVCGKVSSSRAVVLSHRVSCRRGISSLVPDWVRSEICVNGASTLTASGPRITP